MYRLPFATNKTSEELEIVRRYTGYFAEFARTGRPTDDDEWLPYKAGKGRYMMIDVPEKSGMKMEIPFGKDRMDFWRDFFEAKEDWLQEDFIVDMKEEL